MYFIVGLFSEQLNQIICLLYVLNVRQLATDKSWKEGKPGSRSSSHSL